MDLLVGRVLFGLRADSFNLSAIGTYQVLFQVSVTEAGQLILTLNDAELAYTVVGRATGTSQIVGMALVTNDIHQFNTHCTKSCWQYYSTNHHSSRWRNKTCFSTPCYHATPIDRENRMTILYTKPISCKSRLVSSFRAPYQLVTLSIRNHALEFPSSFGG